MIFIQAHSLQCHLCSDWFLKQNWSHTCRPFRVGTCRRHCSRRWKETKSLCSQDAKQLALVSCKCLLGNFFGKLLLSRMYILGLRNSISIKDIDYILYSHNITVIDKYWKLPIFPSIAEWISKMYIFTINMNKQWVNIANIRCERNHM